MTEIVGIHILPQHFFPTLLAEGTQFRPCISAIQLKRCGTQHDYGYAGWCPIQLAVNDIIWKKNAFLKTLR